MIEQCSSPQGCTVRPIKGWALRRGRRADGPEPGSRPDWKLTNTGSNQSTSLFEVMLRSSNFSLNVECDTSDKNDKKITYIYIRNFVSHTNNIHAEYE
jgi:hypothetical protein